MSERDDQEKGEKGKDFSLDEILAEYGSQSRPRPKVVDFPDEEHREAMQQTMRLTGALRQSSERPISPGQQTIRFPTVRPAAPPPRRPPDDEDDEDDGDEEPDGQPSRVRSLPEQKAPPNRLAAMPRREPPSTPPHPRRLAGKPPENGAREDIVEIEPESPLRGIAARLSTIKRRADHYADHMYDHAEPDEESKRAERYLPGVDDEEEPDEARRREPPRKKKRPRPAPPDTPPATLAARWKKGLQGKRVRVGASMLLSVLCVAVCVADPAALGLPAATPTGVAMHTVRQAVLLGLLALTGTLCAEVIGRGLLSLATLRLGTDTLLSLAFFATLGDTLARVLTPQRQGLPCCAVTAFALAFALWGENAHRQGDRISARTAAQTKQPFVVTLDEEKWSGRPAYAKWSGTQAGFGSQIQSEDGVQRAYALAAPLLLLACLVASGLCGAAGGWSRALWCASATLTAACAWSAPLVYSLPYRKLARRLFGAGAALAGWPGVSRCRPAGILMGDNDLFPTGSVQVSGVRVFGDFPNEKVVAYTATLLRVLNCGLTRPFHDLLRSQGAFYREASQIRFHEGGVTGAIRGQEVFVGTAAFMHLMDVNMPQGLNVKHAIFCAINGQLAGIFALHYSLSATVRPCLSALMQAGASPILATRDPNLIPALMGEKFKLPVDKMEFPAVDRRLELSDAEQDHDDTPVAYLSREGLGPYCDAVVGGRRLRSATRLGIIFALAESVAGVALTFYLTYLDAASSLTPINFLLYMALWLVPTALLSHWVEQF